MDTLRLADDFYTFCNNTGVYNIRKQCMTAYFIRHDSNTPVGVPAAAPAIYKIPSDLRIGILAAFPVAHGSYEHFFYDDKLRINVCHMQHLLEPFNCWFSGTNTVRSLMNNNGLAVAARDKMALFFFMVLVLLFSVPRFET